MDKKKRKREEKKERGRERERAKRERGRKGFSFLSKIYENRIVGFHELRVGTKILEFRQTPRGRDFPTLIVSSLKAI